MATSPPCLQTTLDGKAPLASPAFTGTPTAHSAAAYTLALSDAWKLVTFNNAAVITLTIPAKASVALPIGTWIDLLQ